MPHLGVIPDIAEEVVAASTEAAAHGELAALLRPMVVIPLHLGQLAVADRAPMALEGEQPGQEPRRHPVHPLRIVLVAARLAVLEPRPLMGEAPRALVRRRQRMPLRPVLDRQRRAHLADLRFRDTLERQRLRRHDDPPAYGSRASTGPSTVPRASGGRA